MKFLAIEKEVKGNAEKSFDPHLRAEAEKVWQYYKKGFIREIYFTKESHEAVIVLECGSKKEAEEHLNSFPLVKAGLITFSIEELVPYDGFDRLFRS